MNGVRSHTGDKQIIEYSKFHAEQILKEIRKERMLNDARLHGNGMKKLMASLRMALFIISALIPR